jgi:hypothetical protein
MQGTWRAWLPAEHGVWGLIAASALVGLPLGGDLAGLPLILAAVIAVLLRARCAGGIALRASAAAIALMLGCTVVTWLLADGRAWQGWATAAGLVALLPPLLPRRSVWTSVLGGVAFALLSAATAVAGGAPTAWAVLAASVLAVHLSLMVPLVRAQIRPDPRWGRWTVDEHVAAAYLTSKLWSTGMLPPIIPLLFVLSLARCVVLVDKRTPMSVSPARIGLREMAWLPVVAAGVALALRGGVA